MDGKSISGGENDMNKDFIEEKSINIDEEEEDVCGKKREELELTHLSVN